MLAYPERNLMRRRFFIAAGLALLLHLVFLFFIAPLLKFNVSSSPTEVIQITPDELEKLKQRVKEQDRFKPALLEQELKKEYETTEAPKDAKFMGAFNQTVPKETKAGAQREAPKDGGGKPGGQNEVKLSQLGLGSKVPPPAPTPANEMPAKSGPPGPHVPVGREDPAIEKGNENLLNAAASKYYSFFVRFEDPIVRNWFFLMNKYEGRLHEEIRAHGFKEGTELPVTVQFTIDRQGAFKSIEIIESSRVAIIDWATKEAVSKLGSLPNPPPDLFEGSPYFSQKLRFAVILSGSVMGSNPGLSWH